LRSGCINKRREAIVRIAWDKLAPNGEKVVSIARLSECYDVSRNSDYLDGTQSKEQIFQTFVDGLSYNGRPITEVNCFSEWSYYQADLSLTIVDDEYFVRMTEAVWGV
jgi:hypothetical protein